MENSWFWTTQVQEVMETLVRNGFNDVQDVSYHNDQCPSILVGEYLVFLPNSENENPYNEEYSGYVIILDEEYAFDRTYGFSSKSFNSVLQELKKNVLDVVV